MKSILILPAYNEGRAIADLVREAKSFVQSVLVVNDGSRDDTAQWAKSAGAHVLSHRINLGKAAALKTGCEAAVMLGADIVVLMDSDGQHQPKDIPRVIQPILVGKASIVVASRKGGGKMPLVRNLGNRLLELSVRTLFGVAIRDIQSGFRAFHTSVYPKLRWEAKNYHADAEMTVRIGLHRLSYQEVFIDIIYHDSFKGMSVADGLKLLGNIFLWRITL